MRELLWNALMATEYIFTTRSSPVLRDRVAAKIASFGLLPDGWDFGVGRAAPSGVIEVATKLHERGSMIGLPTDAFPGTGGEIYVAFYKDEDTVEIRVNLDLSCNIALERGIGVDFEELEYREHLSFDAARDYLGRFSLESRCNLSEPYIAVNTINNANDSQVTASRTTIEVSRLSTPSVLRLQVPRYANT